MDDSFWTMLTKKIFGLQLTNKRHNNKTPQEMFIHLWNTRFTYLPFNNMQQIEIPINRKNLMIIFANQCPTFYDKLSHAKIIMKANRLRYILEFNMPCEKAKACFPPNNLFSPTGNVVNAEDLIQCISAVYKRENNGNLQRFAIHIQNNEFVIETKPVPLQKKSKEIKSEKNKISLAFKNIKKRL